MTSKQNYRECYDSVMMNAQTKVSSYAGAWRKMVKEWECLAEIASSSKSGKSSKAVSALTYTEGQIESNKQAFDRNLFELEEKQKAELIALKAKHKAQIQALKEKHDHYESYLIKQREQKQKELREAAAALTPAQVRCKAKAMEAYQEYKDAILRFRKEFPDDANLVSSPPQMPEWLIPTGSTPDNLSVEEPARPQAPAFQTPLLGATNLREFFAAPAAQGGGSGRRLPPPSLPLTQTTSMRWIGAESRMMTQTISS